MSWDLKVGEMREVYLTEQQLWQMFNFFFSPKSKNTTTYKFGLIKSLIENLYNVNENLEVSYYRLFESFTKIYWNLVVHHRLRQSNHPTKKSAVEMILLRFQREQHIPNDMRFDQLPPDLQLAMIEEVKKSAKRYVIGALYGDFRGVIYTFDIKAEYMQLNSAVYQFMLKYQKVITYLTNYHLALYLEKHNEAEDTMHILLKVENVSKRSSLDKFYHILTSFLEKRCFYCGKSLSERRKAHVDHFIPWSFVQADHLWNLVLACSECNLSKRDRIADGVFLTSLIDRNEKLGSLNESIIKREFAVYRPENLRKLYDYCIINGFENQWTPKNHLRE
ncbi:HNH endonuclease [Geobacillus sp. 47C-IIb]|jgi:5-methylcytosine-specific restriction endonuclease McrA|uniref:HNH endonuclease n=1 Tax=Geobacillus TaxID=129337 RepID=UPI0009BE7B6F|nr:MULTISPECIES: HNH endonuclease [Geobacillus]MED3718987.1 HNH endonuclease domain-containing protein [Geobacillus thermodenitrificans]OQP08635.1 HNH endonuclease [Geobacillus sp. 47C-IIb]QNU31664.1 HNH endonuclease [Geobacillus sp. 47C-IIb]